MARRKNRRAPARRLAQQRRLDQVWVRQRPPRIPGLTVPHWPALSAETLWTLQYAGLRHLIGQGNALAEQWLTAIEQAMALESGSALTGAGTPEQRNQKVKDLLNQFSRQDRTRGHPKAGTDWAPIEEEVRQITAELGFWMKRFPDWRAVSPSRRDSRLVRFWHTFFRARPPLDSRQINNINVALMRSVRRAAVTMVAIEQKRDPDLLADALYKWNKKHRSA